MGAEPPGGPRYPGKRSVRVKLSANNAAVAKGETAKGTLYLLARRA